MRVTAHSRRFAASALAAGLLLGLTGAAGAVPACQFVSGGTGLTFTVALRASPDQTLSVDWGDGTSSSTSRAISAQRGRAHLRHTYGAPGRYRVIAQVSTPAGAGCGTELEATTPFDRPFGDDAAAVFPDDAAPDTSDQMEDHELGPALAEIDLRAGVPRRDESESRRGFADAIESFVRSLGARFFGR